MSPHHASHKSCRWAGTCREVQCPKKPPHFSTHWCCPWPPLWLLQPRLSAFPRGCGPPTPCGPPDWTVPSSGSSLGFGGCHIPVHIIGLPVLVWASCQGKRCFPQGCFCGPRGRWSEGSHGHAQPSPVSAGGTTQTTGKAHWLVCPSLPFCHLPAVRPARRRAGAIPSKPLDGQWPRRTRPQRLQCSRRRSCHGQAAAATDAPEASLWDQLDRPRGSPPGLVLPDPLSIRLYPSPDYVS